MTAPEPSLAEKVSRIHAALDGERIAHAFGGALALAYYGEPRLTVDIDVNVFVEAVELDTVMRTLEPLGAGEVERAVRDERDGQMRIWWGRNPVDLFFSYDAFHDAMKRDARLVEFGEGRIPILSPEHLIVCKAVFDRTKDWIDIEQMLLGVAFLDRDEIFSWLERILPAGDRRIERLSGLWAANR